MKDNKKSNKKNEFLYICDCHYGAQPVSRIDDYNSSILHKLDINLKLAQVKNIPLLIGGDLFDTPKISIHKLMDIFYLFNLYRDVEIIINRGNHSHDGHPKSSPLTMLDIAFENVIISDNNPFVCIDDMNIVLAPNETNPLLFENFINENMKYNILMTHHIIVEKPIPFEHYLIEEFKTNFDYVLLADYHLQQGIIVKDNTTFISPGALARRKNITSDIERIPSYVYFKDGVVKIETLDVVKNVFVEKVQDEKQDTSIIDNVKKMIELVDLDINSKSINDAIDIFAEKMKTDKKLINYIKERMGEL